MMRARTKLIWMGPIFAAAVWLTTTAGVSGSDEGGLVAVILWNAGLLVIAEYLFAIRYGDIRLFIFNTFVLGLLGAVGGTISRGETAIGMFSGISIGIVSGFAQWWLRGGSIFRPRPIVFVSYRRQDSDHACGRLYQALVREFGRQHVFVDVDSIPLGTDFVKAITGVLARCHAVLALIGHQWLTIRDQTGVRRLDNPEDYVRLELETAFSVGVPVIPVYVGDAPPPTSEQLPAGLAALSLRNGIRLRSEPDFEHDTRLLVRRIRALLMEHQGGVDSSAAKRARWGPKARAWRAAVLIGLFVAPLVWMLLLAATDGIRNLKDAVLSPDGAYVAAVYGQGIGTPGTVQIWDTRTGRGVARSKLPGAPFLVARWSPNGNQLATGTHDGDIHVWQVPGLADRHTMSGPQGMVQALSWE
jgi:hypothetical protein